MLSVLSCLSCLSVTLVYCGQTVGWFKMKLGTEVGLGPGRTVLDGDPASPQKDTAPRQFSAHVYCGQTVVDLSTAELLCVLERCSSLPHTWESLRWINATWLVAKMTRSRQWSILWHSTWLDLTWQRQGVLSRPKNDFVFKKCLHLMTLSPLWRFLLDNIKLDIYTVVSSPI